MKFETIIFLVILFNVVTAFLQRRAKKQKEKLRAGGAGKEFPINAREKAVSLGRGLLEQLAKEFGLRLPKSEPEEIPYSPPPATTKLPEIPDFHAEVVNIRATAPTDMPQPEAAKNRLKAISYFGLNAPKMREAVILREILDKPVSLRTGRFKR